MAKYSTVDIELLGREGKAYKNPDGHYSYPIADVEDLRNAIRAVGRSGADHNSVRKYVMSRARALSKPSLIPDSWQADGSLKESKAQPGGVEVRAQSDGSVMFIGYATIFDYWYNVASYEECFRAGSFRRTLNEEPDTVLLVNHEGLALARTTSGTLRLVEDQTGLRVEAELAADDPQVKMLQPRIERNDVCEMSLAFSVLGEDGQEWSEGFSKREILSANIHRGDVSVVTMGANDATSTAFRGAELTLEQRRRTAEDIGGRITGRRGNSFTENTCARCEGRGVIPCPVCRGDGKPDPAPGTPVDGLEEPPPVGSSPDDQRGVILADLDTARAEVEALRDGESRKAWELEVKTARHELQIGRLRSRVDLHERLRRERARIGV